MDANPKLIITIWVGFVVIVYALVPVLYQRNKKEYDRRYWGKNRTWLKETRNTAVGMAVILTLFLLAIWLSP